MNVLPRGAVNTSIHTIAQEEVRFCNERSESLELSYAVMRAREPPPDGHTLPILIHGHNGRYAIKMASVGTDE